MLKSFAKWSKATAFLLASAAVVQACSSDGPTTTTGSIALTIAPTSATVQQGGSTIVTGTVVRTNFTGAVAVTVEGVPTGATGTVVVTGNSAAVTIAVTNAAVVGPSTITVRAKGTGLTTDATAAFTLTVAAPTVASYTMTLGAPTLSVVQSGLAGTATLTFVRSNFTGNVALAIDNLPTGVTAAFSPNPALTANATSTLTLTAGPTALATLTNLVIRGTSAGMTDVTAPLALTVTAAPGFTVLATPAARTLAQSASNGVGGVKAARTGGFAGVVAYSLTGAPTGLTAVFTATAVTDSTQVTLTTTGAVAAGVYTTVIHGISGAIDQTTPLAITVTAPTGAIRLDYSACGVASKPVWVAFQDGSGAWTRVTGVADVYTFTVASTKGALAVVSTSGAVFSTGVQYFSQAEFMANVGGCGTAAAATKSVNGSVAGLGASDAARISLGGSSAVVATNTGFVLPTVVATGTFDLVGFRRNGSTPGITDRSFVRRDQNIVANTTMAVADFASLTESFAQNKATLTTTGGGAGDQLVQSMAYLTGAACTSSTLYGTTGTAVAFDMFGFQDASQRATDFHSVTVNDVSGVSSRSTSLTFHTMAAKSIAFGALLTPTITTVTGALAYKRLQAAFTLPTDYQMAFLSYSDAAGNTVVVTQTAGFLAGATALTVNFPDFTGAAGLTTTWFPAAAAPVNYSLSGFNLPATNPCTEGATTKFVTVTGTN